MMQKQISEEHRPSAAMLNSDDLGEFQGLVHEATSLWMDDRTTARRGNQLVYLVSLLLNESHRSGSSKVVPLDERPGTNLQ